MTIQVGHLNCVWLGNRLRALLTALTAAVREGGLLVLTGDLGAGKTTLANALVAELGTRAIVASLPYPDIDTGQLYRLLAEKFGLGSGTRESFLAGLPDVRRAAKARDATLLIVVDEAQQLAPTLLAELAGLGGLDTPADAAPLCVLLVGLDGIPRLPGEQRHRVRPMADDEMREFLRWRLQLAGFDPDAVTPAAVREVARLTGGVPRLVERVSDVVLTDGLPSPRAVEPPPDRASPAGDAAHHAPPAIASPSDDDAEPATAASSRRSPVSRRTALVLVLASLVGVYVVTALVQARDRPRAPQHAVAPSAPVAAPAVAPVVVAPSAPSITAPSARVVPPADAGPAASPATSIVPPPVVPAPAPRRVRVQPPVPRPAARPRAPAPEPAAAGDDEPDPNAIIEWVLRDRSR